MNKSNLMGTIFKKFGTDCKVINYDYNSGKYIYKIILDGTIGYVSEEEIIKSKELDSLIEKLKQEGLMINKNLNEAIKLAEHKCKEMCVEPQRTSK